MSGVNPPARPADDGRVTPSRLRSAAGDERGFGLVEVLLSAALLLIGTLGTLTLLDGMQKTSTGNRARSVAAQLAEQDQERLREMDIPTLATYLTPASRDVQAAGNTYTVTSQADWISDASGASVSCTSGSTQTQYLRISSTVANTTIGAKVNPVKIVSLVAPSAVGGLAVEVDGRDGTGRSGVPVGVSGAQSASAQTNTLGCAVFNSMRPGSYAVQLNSAGWVNPLGVQDVRTSATVSPGTVNGTAPQLYDRAAQVTVSFDTKAYGSNTAVPSQATRVTFGNSGMANATGTRSFPDTALTTPASTITATGLFPFSSGYAVYSGSCTANSAAATTVATNPGGTYTAVVHEPALNVNVVRNGSPLGGATVYIRNATAGCDSFTATTGANGRLADPGFPSGTYTICVTDGIRQVVQSNVQNTNLNGTTNGTLPRMDVGGNSSTLGTCP
jgi:Tfp pilus assembly protein PilV